MLLSVHFMDLFYHNDGALSVKGCQSQRYDDRMTVLIINGNHLTWWYGLELIWYTDAYLNYPRGCSVHYMHLCDHDNHAVSLPNFATNSHEMLLNTRSSGDIGWGSLKHTNTDHHSDTKYLSIIDTMICIYPNIYSEVNFQFIHV